ncbi:unnamed protein product, partial [Polarella glacialis]
PIYFSSSLRRGETASSSIAPPAVPTMEDKLWDAVAQVKAKGPLVQCLTNFVSMDFMANGLLALGASPAMIHSTGELAAAVPIVGAIGGAVSINIGTLDERWIESFKMTVRLCKDNNVPWVLDPVAAGFTPLRTETALELMEIYPPAVLRGNGSEILALSPAPPSEGGATEEGGKGVDSSKSSDAALDAAVRLAARFGCVVCVSGAVDYVVFVPDAGEDYVVFVPDAVVSTCPHGVEMLTKVTGAGCLVTSVIGAFVAAAQATTTAAIAEAATLAFTFYGICAELAAKESSGPGSFRVAFLDKLYSTTRESSVGIAIKTSLSPFF